MKGLLGGLAGWGQAPAVADGLWGPGSTHSALWGGLWSAVLGGGVAALWPGASFVCGVFPLRRFFGVQTISDPLRIFI